MISKKISESKAKSWVFRKEINISMIIHLISLAILILGTWIDLQKQLYVLQHDVAQMIQTQEFIQERIQVFHSKNIAFDYRIENLEEKLKHFEEETEK